MMHVKVMQIDGAQIALDESSVEMNAVIRKRLSFKTLDLTEVVVCF